MGGGPSIPAPPPAPPAPTPIDYDKMYAAATRGAIAQMKEQEAQIERLYPKMTSLQMQTARELAGNLDNEYLARTRGVIAQELGDAATPSAIEAELQRRSQQDLLAGPTTADRQIQSAGMGAMGVRADQVGGPRNIREIRAAQMGPVRDVQSRDVSAARMGPVQDVNAVNAQRVADVQSRDVGSGQLGDALMAQALERAQSGGRLSAEAGRDATQAARAGMAARGMATGSAGLAAELLNRDRFTRQRQTEDNAFAQSVQGQDLQRQFSNQDAAMRAAMANQQVGAQMSLADQAAAMDAQRLNQAAGLTIGQTNAQFAQQAGLANQEAAMRAALANQQTAFNTGQVNVGMRQQAAMANQQRDQVLGEMAMRAQMANQSANQNQLAQNRAFMLDANTAFVGAEMDRRNAALGANQLDLARRGRRITLAEGYGALDPFARGLNPAFGLGQATMGQGAGMIGNTFANNLQTAGNVESFNRNMQAGMYNTWQNNNAAIQAANITGRASQQAGQMAMMGGIAQGLGSVNWSDKRMKKDIKPVGKGGGVLGLTAYEYRYKGESKDAPKHVGFMAQDVQKVLPEAVEEIDHKGKKRLAIKPQVIGQALAAELEAQQEAMFAEGYTVK